MKNSSSLVLALIFLASLSSAYGQVFGNPGGSQAFLSLKLVPITSDNLLSASLDPAISKPLYAGIYGRIDTNNLPSFRYGISVARGLVLFPSIKGSFLDDFFLVDGANYYDIDIGGNLLFQIFPTQDLPIDLNLAVKYRGKNQSPLNPTDDATSLFKLEAEADYLFHLSREGSMLDLQLIPYLRGSYSTDSISSPDLIAAFSFDTRFMKVEPDKPANSLWAALSIGLEYNDTSFYAHESKLLFPADLKLGRALVEFLSKNHIDLGTDAIEIGITLQAIPVYGIDRVHIAYSAAI